MNWCRIFGHKWIPVYVKGIYRNISVEFIACYCDRCDKGYDELLDTIQKQTPNQYNTYNEKYFTEKSEIENKYQYNPDHAVGTCGKCGKEMIYNVPRLGSAGGYIHKETNKLECKQDENEKR